jgi:magnesium chelatase subunit H
VLAGDARHYDGAIAALEAQGLNVIPCFASGLDARPAMDVLHARRRALTVDAVLSLTGFSLVGGPAYNDSAAPPRNAGRSSTCPISPPMRWSSRRWSSGAGRARPDADRGDHHDRHPRARRRHRADRVRRALGRATGLRGLRPALRLPLRRHRLARHERLRRARRDAGAPGRQAVRLRRAERAERRIAITLFNFPPNAGATGTAAFLSVFESLHRTLITLRDAGYAVEVPETSTRCATAVLGGNAEQLGQDANVHARVSAETHVRREKWLKEIEAAWGPAPGRVLTDGRDIFILGERFGNVFVGVQPGFGYEGDPMRLLFESGFAPTHAFSAYYGWLREDFDAHAVLHFGTHGALEFMPGKQTGLDGDSWPDRLIGDLPNIYLYAANNPSEGRWPSAARRRRWSAT